MNYISATARGMVGDDAADNSAAFQNALNTAKADSSRTLFIEPGTYQFSERVVIPTNLAIIGGGSPGDMGGYDLLGEQPSVRLKFTGQSGAALYLPGCSSNRIENLSLEGITGRNTTGLCVANEMYLNGMTTDGSPIVTGVRSGGFPLEVGQIVRSDTGIPTNTTILSVGNGEFTMDKNATETHTHIGNSLCVADPNYPNGWNYPGFAGNHLTVQGLSIRNFRVGLFSHFLGGAEGTQVTIANNEVGLWVENAIHTNFRQIWIGGSDYGLNNGIGLRAVGNQSGMEMRGVEFFVLNKCVEAEQAVVAIANANCEHIEGPFFSGDHGSFLDLSVVRFAMARNPSAIPVLLKQGCATINAPSMVGGNHYVLCNTTYPRDVFVTQFGRVYGIRQIDLAGNEVVVMNAGLCADNVTFGTLPTNVIP